MSKKIEYWAVHGKNVYDMLDQLNGYIREGAEVLKIYTPRQTEGEGWVALILKNSTQGGE